MLEGEVELYQAVFKLIGNLVTEAVHVTYTLSAIKKIIPREFGQSFSSRLCIRGTFLCRCLINNGDKWAAEHPLPLTPSAASRPIGIPVILNFSAFRTCIDLSGTIEIHRLGWPRPTVCIMKLAIEDPHQHIECQKLEIQCLR